jgi:hypothetical protein
VKRLLLIKNKCSFFSIPCEAAAAAAEAAAVGEVGLFNKNWPQFFSARSDGSPEKKFLISFSCRRRLPRVSPVLEARLHSGTGKSLA